MTQVITRMGSSVFKVQNICKQSFFYDSALVLLGIFFLSGGTDELAARLPTEIQGEGKRTYRQFIFLFERTTTDGQSETHLYPFYSLYKNKEKAYQFHTFLYPFFQAHGTNYWRKWNFLSIFRGESLYHKKKGADTDLWLTFFFNIGWGEQPEDRYVSFFPIYGKIKDIFGYEVVRYVLFPIYADWSYKDYKAHGILWPIIMWGKSKKRRDFRFLPFYSSLNYEGNYKRRTLLWPLFQWGSLGISQKEPRHYFLFFPVFGYKWSAHKNLKAFSLFLGLFSYGREKITKSTNWTFLWFLFQYGKSEVPGIQKLIIFPFYGYYRFGQSDQSYYRDVLLITPLYFRYRTYSAILDTVSHFVIPFYSGIKRFYHKEREFQYYRKVWPFFQYYKDSQGSFELRVLALWPFPTRQIDKQLGVFYSLFEYRKIPNGDRYLSFLFRLYSVYWNTKDKERHHFFLGFEWHQRPDYWGFEFLGGFFGLHSIIMDDGKRRIIVELLWMDIRRPKGIDPL